MKKRLTFALGMLLWGLCNAVFADPLDPALKEVMAEPLKMVAEWESDRTYAFGMVATVFILGVIIAFIHTLPTEKAKLGAVALGSAVTVLTGLSNLYFDFDHRQYKALANEGRALLSEMRVKEIRVKEVPLEQKETRDAMFEDIRKDARAIRALGVAVREKSGSKYTGVPPLDGFISSAWAQQDSAPAWTTKVPTDEANLYFVGYADGRDYVAVRKASQQASYDDARSFLAGRLDTGDAKSAAPSNTAAAYLLDAAIVKGDYVAYDKATNTYRAYTLLSLSKQLAESDLKVFAAKNSLMASIAQTQALKSSLRSPNDYLSQRMQVYTAESAKAQVGLALPQYEQYLQARKLRQDGKFAEAIPKLKDVIQQKPDFYLGWFNLALAYEERGEVANAKEAYERAIALESSGQLRDASLYNTYGYFLFKNKQYKEAAASLRTALKIAPDHPKARATLTAAEAAGG